MIVQGAVPNSLLDENRFGLGMLSPFGRQAVVCHKTQGSRPYPAVLIESLFKRERLFRMEGDGRRQTENDGCRGLSATSFERRTLEVDCFRE